jgi:hypothetical protein
MEQRKNEETCSDFESQRVLDLQMELGQKTDVRPILNEEN